MKTYVQPSPQEKNPSMKKLITKYIAEHGYKISIRKDEEVVCENGELEEEFSHVVEENTKDDLEKHEVNQEEEREIHKEEEMQILATRVIKINVKERKLNTRIFGRLVIFKVIRTMDLLVNATMSYELDFDNEL